MRWCGHCQKFSPVYERVARVAKKKLPSLTVAAINCASTTEPSNKEVCAERGKTWHRYPNLVFFPGEERYNGSKAHENEEKTTRAILKWAAAQMDEGDAAGALDGELGEAAAREAAPAGELPLRPSLTPVPVADVMAAARYGLVFEVPD